MVDGRILALGTNITSTTTGSRQVTTSIDQRRLPMGNLQSFIINGEIAGNLSSREITGDSWVHLAYPGSDAGGGIAQAGWFIPHNGNDFTLRIGQESRQGTWDDTNRPTPINPNPTFHTDQFASIYIDHGIRPNADRYEYVVLPNATQAEIEAFAAAQAAEEIYVVLYATNTLHSVFDFSQNVLMIVNFANEPASVTSPKTGITYTIDGAGSVLIREQEGRIHIGIHDPVGNQVSITVGIYGQNGSVEFADANIAVAQEANRTLVTANELTRFQNRRFNTWEAVINLTPIS